MSKTIQLVAPRHTVWPYVSQSVTNLTSVKVKPEHFLDSWMTLDDSG